MVDPQGVYVLADDITFLVNNQDYDRNVQHHPEMAPGKKCWGDKNCQSANGKIFTDHIFRIGLKCDYTL